MIGYSYQDDDAKGIYQWAKDFPTDMFGPWNTGSMNDMKAVSYTHLLTTLKIKRRINMNNSLLLMQDYIRSVSYTHLKLGT